MRPPAKSPNGDGLDAAASRRSCRACCQDDQLGSILIWKSRVGENESAPAPRASSVRAGQKGGLARFGSTRRAARGRINKADCFCFHGCAGPLPAPVVAIAAAISRRSSGIRRSVAASSQPSTCAGLRAPTMAPVTAGHAKVHATVTSATLLSCRAAIGRTASARTRLRIRPSPVKSGDCERQSSLGRDLARSAVRLPSTAQRPWGCTR
jgi:hypothetical protein